MKPHRACACGDGKSKTFMSEPGWRCPVRPCREHIAAHCVSASHPVWGEALALGRWGARMWLQHLHPIWTGSRVGSHPPAAFPGLMGGNAHRNDN